MTDPSYPSAGAEPRCLYGSGDSPCRIMASTFEPKIARVRGELVAFRDVCLPALLEPAENAGYSDDLSRPLGSWRGAVNRLLDALPKIDTGEVPLPRTRLITPSTCSSRSRASSHVVRSGRISWRD